MLAQQWRARVLAPTILTAELPGIGGRIRARLEDFRVDEIPAYGPDGGEGHRLVELEKRGVSTEDAIATLARALSIDAREIGFAGRKDREGVSKQWISVPAHASAGLASFADDRIALGEPRPHSHKLRIGHLHGNRFDIVVRELDVEPEIALVRARAKLDRIAAQGGVPNSFGPQRFGRDGEGLDRGLAAMQRGKGGARANMTVAAGQAALFNLWIELRIDRDALHRVLVGDVLAKTATGGLFTSTDATIDDARRAAGEVAITGPIFGSRTMQPPPGTPAADHDADVLALATVDTAALRALGRAAVGTRRRMLVPLQDVAITIAQASADTDPAGPDNLSSALRLRFTLPAGSFATQVCRELGVVV